MNGGTLSIDSPRPYSAVADGLLKTLGIDPVALTQDSPPIRNFYASLGLRRGVFFDQETFGADKLVVVRRGSTCRAQLLARSAAVAARAQATSRGSRKRQIDYLPGLSSAEKKSRLSRISYRDFLLDVVKADPASIAFYQARTHGEWGVGIDAVSALDVWAFDFPGFQGSEAEPGSAPHMGYTAAGYADGGSYTFHFPDGNASIARLLVRNLIPASVPGSSAEDVVTARLDYARLDRPQSPGAHPAHQHRRARPQHRRSGSRHRSGDRLCARRRAFTVRAQACVLACYNMMIPYLCPELPRAAKGGAALCVKIPLVYTSVACATGRPSRLCGIAQVYAPGSYFSTLSLNQVVDIGDYRSPRSPDEPVLVHMMRTPAQPGLPEHDQNRAGRLDLLTTTFETFERNIRDQLARILGPGGFDPARDITAITVNRWPHGYAYEYNPLFDPDWPQGQRAARDRPRTLRPHRDRQLRRRRGRLHGLGDRPGLSRGAGIALALHAVSLRQAHAAVLRGGWKGARLPMDQEPSGGMQVSAARKVSPPSRR